MPNSSPAPLTTRSAIVVLGSINTDLVIRGPRLPAPGETVLGGEFFRAAGGKGANQAVAAARLAKGPVTFVGAVGDDDFGRVSLENLRRENLDCRHIKTVPGKPSGIALILVDALGENLIGVASGANGDLSPNDVEALPVELFDGARVFLTCLESPLHTVVRALQRAKSAGCRTILNPAPAHAGLVGSGCLDQVDVLTPNESEASSLTGFRVTDLDSAAAAAIRLCELGCGAAIVTRGAAGCVVVEGSVATCVEARKVTAVDTTAAGDAFNGAVAVALAEGCSLTDAARWATEVAAISVTRPGAQPSLPTRGELSSTG
jgi:ribokinase